jgi:hypothetical protein
LPNKNENKKDITNIQFCGSEAAYPSGAPGFITVFSGVRVVPSLVFSVMFYTSLFVFLSFFLAIILYVLLGFTASVNPFVVFKLFLIRLLKISQWYVKY